MFGVIYQSLLCEDVIYIKYFISDLKYLKRIILVLRIV